MPEATMHHQLCFTHHTVATYPLLKTIFYLIGVLLCFCLLLYPAFGYAETKQNIKQPFWQHVEKQYQRLYPHRSIINKQFSNHQPTIQHILLALDANNLPRSFALIPMIESSFNSKAVSPAKAAGLWQLMPATAKRFGLVVTSRQDDRFNIEQSTKAAIKYLRFLYNKFDQDIKLTLAAYNSGEGRVGRALKREVDRHFTALALPQETIDYVHKFYALHQLVDIEKFRSNTQLSLFDTHRKNQASSLSHDDKIILDQLFDIRSVINMKPVKPLIDLN